jgi:DNA-binding MarR family transcriptional regulator
MRNKNPYHYQQRQNLEAEGKIIKALLDGKAHEYGELIKITKLSKPTLSLHLKEMVKKDEVLRIMDTNEKYPYPVSYRLKKSLPVLDRINKEIVSVLKIADENFRETLDPDGFFLLMNDYVNLNMLSLIPLIRELDKSEKLIDKDRENLTNMWIDILVTQTAEMFATQFCHIVLHFGADLDVNVLTKELIERVKKRHKEL